VTAKEYDFGIIPLKNCPVDNEPNSKIGFLFM